MTVFPFKGRATTPASANWKVWKGVEIEGQLDLGVPTLFVRSHFNPLASPADMHILGEFNRVWFCKEFRNWDTIEFVALTPRRVCVEVMYHDFDDLPAVVRDRCVIYLVLPRDLKSIDHVKIGTPYEEVILMTGGLVRPGWKVETAKYHGDEVIKP